MTLPPISMEVEHVFFLKGNDPIGDTPIFHWNVYGRKGTLPKMNERRVKMDNFKRKGNALPTIFEG